MKYCLCFGLPLCPCIVKERSVKPSFAGDQRALNLGSWELNPEGSQLPGDVPEGLSDTRVYSLRDDGYLYTVAVTDKRDGARPSIRRLPAVATNEILGISDLHSAGSHFDVFIVPAKLSRKLANSHSRSWAVNHQRIELILHWDRA